MITREGCYLMLNVTARLDLMSKILDTLKAVVEDAKFDFKENSLHIRVVDHSHVAMTVSYTHLTLPTSAIV